MANDRVFIRCNCGAFTCLLKTMGAGLYTPNHDLDGWLNSHGACHPHAFSPDLRGDPGFELVTENASDLNMALLNKGPVR